MTFAYLADRHVHLLYSGETTAERLVSPYIEDVRRRSESSERKSAWKAKGSGAQFMGAAALWDEPEGRLDPAWFTCLSRGRTPGELLYAVTTGVVSALLAYDVETKEETRLVHGQEAPTMGIATSDDHTVLALVRRHKNGSSNLAVMRDDGGESQLVTDGDAIDDAPSWVPVGPEVKEGRHQLVFASRGIGRDAAGMIAGFAPTEIQLLDAEQGDLKTLVQDPAFDYLEPRMMQDGHLYAMKRPYREGPEGPRAGAVLKDGILAPFRLAYAGFRYLDYFSQKYAGKPLTTSGDTRGRNVDARRLVERQNIAAAGRGADDDDEATKAPRDWLLVRCTPGATDTVIAHHVAAYDIGRNGVIHVTDGKSIERIDDAKSAGPLHKRTRIATARFATTLVPVAAKKPATPIRV